jgi:C1A family cysteine protease
MINSVKSKGKGWLKDYPDFRDNNMLSDALSAKQKLRGNNKTVKDVLTDLEKQCKKTKLLPEKVDLINWCSPIENQGSIGSCTAHAGTSLYEYFERRANGKHIDASRLFLYKTSRNLLGWTEDDGCYLRTTMAAMALFGLVPEKYWPYVESDYKKEPDAFHYSFAQNYQALLYYRLDAGNTSKTQLLHTIKDHLNKGLPSMFGFTCFSSLDTELGNSGYIPFPERTEEVDGGHAVMAVGYDDTIKIVNPANPKNVCTGAILIRNSWGTEWGIKGYGYLPYKYILDGIADDWWTMTKGEWIDTQHFGNEI